MIRLALPKGRIREAALTAFGAAGVEVERLDPETRALSTRLPGGEVEVLFLKDWDLPLYVERGVADCGVVGSDVLGEVDGDLLVPARLREGACRFSLIGKRRELPRAGEQVTLATKYPRTARRLLAGRAWGAEILELSGSVELAPMLDLADLALDIVQTGRTLAENGLVEVEVLDVIHPCLVVHRAAYQRHRAILSDWVSRLEAAELVL